MLLPPIVLYRQIIDHGWDSENPRSEPQQLKTSVAVSNLTPVIHLFVFVIVIVIAAGVGILKPPASHGIPCTGPSNLAWRWLCWLPWLTRDGFQDVNQFATLRRHEHSLRMGKSADLGIPWGTLDFVLQILGLINYKCDCDSKRHQDQNTPPSMNPHYPLLWYRGKTQEIPGKILNYLASI